MATRQIIIGFLSRFSGQAVGGDSKIPSVVCYDEHGNVVAVGSETNVETNPDLLKIQGLVRAERCVDILLPAFLPT